jgi:hypothetical protein
MECDGIIDHKQNDKREVRKMRKAIYLDMDGTFVNLYSVNNWLEQLRAFNPTPYIEAEPLVRMASLARLLNALQQRGDHIAIVSWLSKESTPEYDEAVTLAKLTWLQAHLPSVQFDEIVIVPYGTPKSEVVEFPEGVLFDDESQNREEWEGEALDPEFLLDLLRQML